MDIFNPQYGGDSFKDAMNQRYQRFFAENKSDASKNVGIILCLLCILLLINITIAAYYLSTIKEECDAVTPGAWALLGFNIFFGIVLAYILYYGSK